MDEVCVQHHYLSSSTPSFLTLFSPPTYFHQADLLGDRIVIMGDGQVLCIGSSLFLKRQYGVGYCATFEKKHSSTFNDKSVIDLVQSFVPEAQLLTSVGAELTLELPFSSSSKFESMFVALDQSLESLGIQSYGVSVTTLEEVFLKVASGSHTFMTKSKIEASKKADIARQTVQSTNSSILTNSSEQNLSLRSHTIAADETELETIQHGLKEAPKFERFEYGKDTFALNTSRVLCMLQKRYLYFRRDRKSWVFQFVLPVTFTLVGALVMAFSKFSYPQPLITLSVAKYNPAFSVDFLPLPFTSAPFFCDGEGGGGCWNVSGQESLMASLADKELYPIESLETATSIGDVSAYLYGQRYQYKSSRYGAYSIMSIYNSTNSSSSNELDRGGIDYVIHTNYTALHAAPTFSALLAETYIQSRGSPITITSRLHPLPNTKAEKSLYSTFNLSNMVFFIGLSIPFACAAFAGFVLSEREHKTKDQQLISGISLTTYWITSWIWSV
jgi:ATP-binding cassette, subfamily A (ABC1), member 3